MTRGKRYDEPKLNVKKVFGAVIALCVLIMIITSIVKILKNDKNEDDISGTTYFSVYSDGKWGVIDNEGKKVIDTTYDEMVIVPNNKKPVFICTYDINDETGEYKTKAINEKGEEILKDFEQIEVIDNYDSKQNIWFEENVLRVKKDGKYGLIDLNGKEIIPCEYENIYSLKSIQDNFIVVKESKLGLVNSKGQFIINTEFSKIETLKEGNKDAYLVSDENGLYGVINVTGNKVLDNKYQKIKYLSSLDVYSVKEDDKLELVNTKGEVLQTSEGEEYVFAKGENVIVKKDDKYGIETLAGETIIPYEYDELTYAFSIYYMAKKDNTYGIINVSNEVIKDFEYLNMYVVEEGSFIVADKTETETVVFDSNIAEKLVRNNFRN